MEYSNIISRADGSYVIDKNGLPYHVPNEGAYINLWQEVDAYAKANPDKVTIEKPYEPTAEELEAQALAQAKAERAEAVSKITVEVDGMLFDGDEESQTRMGRTIAAAVALGVDLKTYKQVWVLADNTVAEVTVSQLAQALKLAGEAQTALWTVPYSAEA